MLELVGRVIDGRYRLDRLVGEGGFGAVFQARHLALDASVAVKILKPPDGETLADGDGQAHQLADEARLLSCLRHPNVVAALDAGVLPAESGAPPRPYLVLEWCAGVTLKEWLLRRVAPGAGLPLAEVWAILGPVGAAIAHAHELGIVHRDLKPANVMMEERGKDADILPRIIDFGIGKVAEAADTPSAGSTATSSHTIAFTPAYAAPEQILGLRTGTWTDIHAFALLFVELVTGRPPYGTDEAELRLSAVSPDRPSAARFGIDVGAFGPPITRALALRPAGRPAIDVLMGELQSAARSLDLPPAALRTPGRETRAILVGHGVDADASTMAEGPTSLPPSESSIVPSRTAFDLSSAPSRSPRKAPTTRRVALAAAALALLGAGLLGVRRLLAPRALGDLDQRTLTERVATVATVRAAYDASNLLYVAFTKEARDGDVTLMRIPTGDGRATHAQVQGALQHVASRPGATRLELVAATDFEWLLYVACADRALAEAVLGAAIDQVEAERIEVPPAIPVVPRAPEAAMRLADLDAGRLISALSTSGEVVDVLAVADAGAVAAATLTEPGSRALSEVHLFRFPTPHAVEVWLEGARKLSAPFTYAVDDSTLLVVRGAPKHCDPAFVRRVLDHVELDVKTWAP